MEDLKALTECAECTWDYIDRLRMALASACKERDEARKELHEAKSELDKYRKAEQAGQLVVLPCKVGDKVRVDARTWGNTWNYKTVDGGKYLLGQTVAIIKTRKQTFIKIRVEHNVSW